MSSLISQQPKYSYRGTIQILKNLGQKILFVTSVISFTLYTAISKNTQMFAKTEMVSLKWVFTLGMNKIKHLKFSTAYEKTKE